MELEQQPSCNHECETCTLHDDQPPWECEVCLYQHGMAPPKGLACLRCRQVLNIFDKIQAEQKSKSSSLVDQLHQMVGCEYLSSLKEPQWHANLLAAIGRIDLEHFPLEEWSAALSYCFDDTLQFDSIESLRLCLAQKNQQL